MALLKIARMGHPVLRHPAGPVADPTAPEIRRLIADMLDTMRDAPGIGLAAPQVHVPLRLVVIDIPAARLEPGEQRPGERGEGISGPLVLCNPRLEILDSTPVPGWEGCLSMPGLRGGVPRPRRVRYHALDREGEPVCHEASGFPARVLQHECDHLDGILYPQRMTDLSLLIFEDEARHGLPDLPNLAGDPGGAAASPPRD